MYRRLAAKRLRRKTTRATKRAKVAEAELLWYTAYPPRPPKTAEKPSLPPTESDEVRRTLGRAVAPASEERMDAIDSLLQEIEDLNNAIDESCKRLEASEEDATRVPSAIYDTGCTSSALTAKDPAERTGKPSRKIFAVATGHTAAATEQVKLRHKLREPARSADIVPGIQESLVSASKFADSGYISVFDKDEVRIYDQHDTEITVSRDAVLRGWRDARTGLWRIPLVPEVSNVNTDTALVTQPPSRFLADCPPPTDAIFNVYELKKMPEIIRYYHAAAGFPTKRTWIAAINNDQYASWPGLTASAVAKHFPESEETAKGHMRKAKSGIRSTKVRVELDGNEDTAERPTTKQRAIYVRAVDLADDLQRAIYTDQTGRFPVLSSQGNRYVMVMLDMDSNYIMVEPMKNRNSSELVRSYNSLIQRLHDQGIRPKHQVLDNEISGEYETAIKKHKMTYQLVPPHDHRRNIAEKAIQVFKDHFISILCGCDPDFPMHLWDRLLPQAELTLNLLRTSRLVPTVSSYAHVYGQFNYDAHPLHPLGCKIEMHVKPSVRESWAAHSASGYYIGTSLKHYRCSTGWLEQTRSTRVSDTVFFKHKYLTQPTLTASDAVIQAAQQLETALTQNLPAECRTQAAITKLMDIFKENAAREKEADARSQRVQKEKAHRQRVGRAAAERDSKETEDDTLSTCTDANDDVSDDDTVPGELLDEIVDPPTTEEQPRYNLRPRNNVRTITQEMMLHAVHIAGTHVPFSAQQAARRQFPLQFLAELAYAVLDGDTGELLEYRHLIKNPKYRKEWGYSFGNEIGRLAQGMPGRTEGTDTIQFIFKHEIPPDRWRDVTYARICCNVRPQKTEKNRTRITVGGDRINYPYDCGTPTADMLLIKMLFNSVVSTPGAKFMTIDIKNFYLCTPLKRKEYLRMHIENFPEDVIDHYNLREKVTKDGFVFVAVSRGMYGLPQAGLLAQQLLEKRLGEHGYFQSKITPGFWTHKWRPISFSLVVDDFGVKYVGREHAEHLISVLQENYEIETDWEGSKYIGMTLDWDYAKREVHLSMPNYVTEALARFKHSIPNAPQNQPHKHTMPTYGAKIQYAKQEIDARKLSKEEKRFVQQVLGTFLFYARAVDSTMLTALSAIASEQADPTELTMEKVKLFLDYAASNPDAILTYRASDMVLAIHSDASYLSESKARSRAGGHFFMSSDIADPPNNGAVTNIAQVIKQVMSSAAEAELGAMYINAREAIPMRQALEEMGHPQPKTPMQVDNSTALGVTNSIIQPKRTKAMDMRYHWLRDREAQDQFRFYWRPGTTNWADYWTKHHCPAHHQEMRKHFLTPQQCLQALRKALNKAPALFRASERVC